MNIALLCKWWWRFGRDRQALWFKVLTSKYRLPTENWLPALPSSSKVSKLWKAFIGGGGGGGEILFLVVLISFYFLYFGSFTVCGVSWYLIKH